MNSIKVNKICVDALLGSDRDKCLRECIQLAVEENVNVSLAYNDSIYKINVEELMTLASDNKTQLGE